jgi:hypothetical protein
MAKGKENGSVAKNVWSDNCWEARLIYAATPKI